MTTELVHALGPSMVCAGCDGEMVLRKDAIGREYLRCPTCSPFARAPRRHPDDAMLPQGLVKSNGAPPRIVRHVVRVEVPAPAPPPEILVQFPPIGAKQLRCQVCARGVDPVSRFCSTCAKGGQLILDATRIRRAAATGTRVVRIYPPKPCGFVDPASGEQCGEMFIPTGPRAKYCDPHVAAARRETHRRALREVPR